jgi:hypothetical protein
MLKLSYLFDVDESTINRHMNFWIPALAKQLRPEILFPSAERIQLLQGTIESDPLAIGSMDMTIHPVTAPVVEEFRFFRGDKGQHFFNSESLVDFTGMFLHFVPGYAGRMSDRTCYQRGTLKKQLQENQANALGDRAFTNEPQITTVNDVSNRGLHMAERARQENTYAEFHQQAKITSDRWRCRKRLHAPTMLLVAELYNFRKRRRLMRGLLEFEKYVAEAMQ